MRRVVPVLTVAIALWANPALAGEADIRAAQSAIESQIRAFLAGNEAAAYDIAAPSIKRLFPTLEQFMAMVKGGYKPVWKPRSFAFGKAHEPTAGSVIQQVLVVGPDDRDYDAIYTLELQPDGSYRITGVTLRRATSLGA